MQEKNNQLTRKVQYLKGVGPRRYEQVARLGIHTVYDLLYYLPRRYEDRRKFSAVGSLEPGTYYTVKGRVKRQGIWKTMKGMLVYEMIVTDGIGDIHAIWYNQPYLKKYFAKARDIILYGKVERFRYLQMTHPDYEVLEEGDDLADSVQMGRIVPLYPLTKDITQKYLRVLLCRAIDENINLLQEAIPTYIRARHKLADIRFAVRNIHFPSSFENLKMAYRRLVFEEFFILETALAVMRKTGEKSRKGIGHKVEKGMLEAFSGALPFKLTESQLKVMKEIEADMKAEKPMNRLLEGEVGSGKTVVAMYGLYVTVKNGLQGAVMVPTEILAQQHYLTMSEFFMPSGFRIRLLVGSLSAGAKDEIKKELKEGRIDIIIGTHSLIQENVSFDKVGLVVIDEQHRFGVSQRSVSREKAASSDILIMTATPIPRTLALTVYGDLDISVMRDIPEGRPPVSTFWVEEERKEKIYNFVREEVKSDRQAYVICPRIDDTGDEDMKSAEATYDYLSSEVFPEFKVGLLHGRIRADEKEKLMRSFKNNKLNILVATSIVEVGIDIPNATVMVIENADRFGLAQLHQLRGRIGRGEHRSYCILVADPKNLNARKRLEAFERLEDGFELAEEDLSIRGPGELLGTRQHGLPDIRFGDIAADKDILELARSEAFALVAKDATLKDERNRNLRDVLIERYKGKMGFLKVG